MSSTEHRDGPMDPMLKGNLPYSNRRNALFIRLLKTVRWPTTGFTLLGTHQGDLSGYLVYDVLQLNVLHKGRLMFQLVRYSRNRGSSFTKDTTHKVAENSAEVY
ncbi:hypothetical protein T265_09135 [Opisthorchis viverrini]|uniref:Uncharacterized protein n=1 Tax=Opisthorchis viverrini TaxID=6198 RepID=A0A074ZBA9_OPIVI|nr:hypothetical protein T265_09135 [Opisthorchis viverrini]KER22862.1 hypothetical protein T265_09135 [Opisthorchis viverrini]